MNKLDRDYLNLLQDILDNGVEKKDRTGTGILSVFGRQIRHKMSDGFPLLTTKKMYFKGIVTELLWFLRGDTSIKYLLENACNIWTGDAFRNYWECNKIQSNPKWLKPVTYSNGNVGAELYNIEEFINKIKTDDEFAKKWGELGPIYGKQWREWNNLKWEATDKIDPSHPDRPMLKWKLEGIDQIQNLINDLKTNSDSRRLMVNSWNVGELDQMVLPPCHYGFQVYTRELSARERTALGSNGSTRLYDSIKEENYKTIDADEEMHRVCDMKNIPRRAISLMFNMRSTDVPLGLPFNIASYGLLLEIIAKGVNMVPDELIGNLGDTHIYLNQIEGIKEQLTREPYQLPTLKHMKTDEFFKSLSEDLSLITHLDSSDFTLENYQSHPAIKLPLSN